MEKRQRVRQKKRILFFFKKKRSTLGVLPSISQPQTWLMQAEKLSQWSEARSSKVIPVHPVNYRHSSRSKMNCGRSAHARTNKAPTEE